MGALEDIIAILEATNSWFQALKPNVDDVSIPQYKEQLRERTTLIVNLPTQIESDITLLDEETAKMIHLRLKKFSDLARQVLETDNLFHMGVLLTEQGDKIGDKNQLEELIDVLKREL